MMNNYTHSYKKKALLCSEPIDKCSFVHYICTYSIATNFSSI